MADTELSGSPSFPRMLAIFFAIFHPTAGPSVIHQIPNNFVSTATEKTAGKINFDSISEYVIPKRQLCDRMVATCVSGYRVLGYPIYMLGSHYERNAFIFNCCVIFDEADNAASYVPVVKRLAKTLKNMEELKGSLSSETGRGVVYHVIEQVLEDLNNYCECMIPIIDDEVTLNIKLFPSYRRPPIIRDWHVPVPTINLKGMIDQDWDLTVQRVIPYIDGVSSVRRIAELSDVDPILVAKAMQHLYYYGCLITTDIFQFGGMYAVTPELSLMTLDVSTQRECLAYVSREEDVSFAAIFALYSSLRIGKSLRDWITLYADALKGIDIRRFITFGVIKGFIYRVHCFPFLAKDHRISGEVSEWADGTRHVDELGVMLKRSPADLQAALKACGSLQLIYR
jgi:hypothetical protein